MRGLVALVCLTVSVAGCLGGPGDPAPAPSASVTGDPADPGGFSSPLPPVPATKARLADGLLVDLPPGPVAVAVIVDVPAELWTEQSYTGQDKHWSVPLRVAFDGLDREDGEAVAPSGERPGWGGVVAFRVAGEELLAGPTLESPQVAQADDDGLWMNDRTPCPPAAAQYLVVLMVDGPQDTSAVLFTGTGEAPVAPTPVRVDLVGGAPTIAYYRVNAGGTSHAQRDWDVQDDRTGTPAPPPAASEVGALRHTLERTLRGPGLYAASLVHSSLVAEAAQWTLEVSVDAASPVRGTYSVAGAYTATHSLMAQGSADRSVRLVSTLDGAQASMTSDEMAAFVAPVDVAALGLRVPAWQAFQETTTGVLVPAAAPADC